MRPIAMPPAPTVAEIRAFLPRARRYSVIDDERLMALMRLTADAIMTRGIHGDIVECGVANGGSACALAWVIRDTDRHGWFYDSFSGMPEPGTIDGPDAWRCVGDNKSSPAAVHVALDGAGFPMIRRHVVEGYFDESFVQPGPTAIALLHIDADWYDSVLACLHRWYDAVAFGGVIVLDDFGYWEGCRHAFYDFARMRNLTPLLERTGRDQAWWIKT